MNFHLVTDNPVYIDTFIEKANKISDDKNLYFLIQNREIKNIKSKGVEIVTLKQALDRIRNKPFRKIYIHYLNKSAIDFINYLPFNRYEIYWFLWGGDAYRHPILKKNLYLPKTQRILERINSQYSLKRIKEFYSSFSYKLALEKCLKKINYCCIQVKGDYDLIMHAVPGLEMKHKFFAYRGAEKNTVDPIRREVKHKFNLLLGNSANPTNNHVDILEKLSDYNGQIEKIICPLSYGGSSDYVKEVIRYGTSNFGDKFSPLTEFLPFDQYQKLMEKIDISVFYHTRQQGYSNTILLLEQNKKILMNPKSTLYQMYKKFDVKNVYSDLDKSFSSELKSNENLYIYLSQSVVDQWYDEVLN